MVLLAHESIFESFLGVLFNLGQFLLELLVLFSSKFEGDHEADQVHIPDLDGFKSLHSIGILLTLLESFIPFRFHLVQKFWALEDFFKEVLLEFRIRFDFIFMSELNANDFPIISIPIVVIEFEEGIRVFL